MKMSAMMMTPRTETGTLFFLHAPLAKQHDQWWERLHRPQRGLRAHLTSTTREGNDRRGSAGRSQNRLYRFFSYFSGPILWALEITAVLLIVLAHSVDFVGIVIIADLVMIVMMMAFRASLGLWQDAHPASSLDVLDRRPAHGASLHHG